MVKWSGKVYFFEKNLRVQFDVVFDSESNGGISHIVTKYPNSDTNSNSDTDPNSDTNPNCDTCFGLTEASLLDVINMDNDWGFAA